MLIVLITHSKIVRFEDPESSPYDRYSPKAALTPTFL